MSNLQEVPTDELLSFQDFPAVHPGNSPNRSAQLNLNSPQQQQQNINILPEPQTSTNSTLENDGTGKNRTLKF